MSIYHVRVVEGRRGALITHPSDSMNPDAFDDDDSGQGRKAAPF